MKFVMSYSCGKDSTLALHKMVEQGHTPVALLVMFNQDQERSWFHGVDRPLLEQIAASLELPLLLCPSSGEEYHLAFEEGLRRAMEMGADGLYRRLTPGKNAPLNSQEYFFKQAYEAVSRGNQTE